MVRKYENTNIRQKQILDAARWIIIKYGSEHLTVKKIAKEVGISETAVYRHFKSKKEILFLLVEYIEQILLEDISRATNKGCKPLEILNDGLRNQISAVEKRRGISFQVIAEIISLGDKKLNSRVSHTIERYTGCLKDLLAEGVKSGEVRDDIDLDAAAIALFGIVQGLVNIWALHNYSFDPKERYAALWSIYHKAVVKKVDKG
jgi:AcrR family transcriptional regulator